MNKTLILVVLMLTWLGSGSSSKGAESFEERERRLQEELERPPKNALDEQTKWDKLRQGFHEAMLALKLRQEPEQKVIERLELLFQKGATINTFDEALESAVRFRATHLTKYLLEKGADPDGFRFDSNPLKIATKFRDQDIIGLLEQYGAKPLDPLSAAQLRLTFSAARGDLSSIKRELRSGASIDLRDLLDHTTALIEAVRFKRVDAVKLLLTLGANPNTSGYVSAIELFVSVEALRSGQPPGMCTPLHAATLHGGHPGIIKLLLNAGAPVSSTKCYKNLTPLHVAAKFQSVSAATVLLKEGAKVMPQDSDGKTPLDYTESGPIIKLLKSYGAKERP